VEPLASSTSPVWLKVGEVTLSVPPLSRRTPLWVTLLRLPAVMKLPLPASSTPPSTILAGEEVPVVASPTDPVVRMALPAAISMPWAAVAEMVPPPSSPSREPMREPEPDPLFRPRLPPTDSEIPVVNERVELSAVPMMAAELPVVTPPPCSAKSAPTFMTREVPLCPPIRAVANPEEPPPVNCTDPAIWMDCTGALTTTLLSVPPAPAVSVRFTPCKLCEPVEEMDAELLVPSGPPRTVKLPSVPALSVWAFSVPEVLIKAELPFPPEPAVSMKPVAAIV
jgi:hypothetical protein